MPTSTAPWPTSVTSSGSILFWNSTSSAGVAVVAGLVGQVELGELDVRDVAEADDQLDRRGRGGGGRGGSPARRRRGAGDPEASAGDVEAPPPQAAATIARTPRSDGRAPRAGRRRRRARGLGGVEVGHACLPCSRCGPGRGTARAARASGARGLPSLIRTLTVGSRWATGCAPPRDLRPGAAPGRSWARPRRRRAGPPVGDCTLPRRLRDRSTAVGRGARAARRGRRRTAAAVRTGARTPALHEQDAGVERDADAGRSSGASRTGAGCRRGSRGRG